MDEDENNPPGTVTLQTLFNMLQTLTNSVNANTASIGALTNSVNGNTASIARHEAISVETLNHVRQSSYPLLGTIASARFVIDAGDQAFLTTNKNGVYTWIRCEGKIYAIGSVHCALTMRTLSLKFGQTINDPQAVKQFGCTFVELPEAILRRKVVKGMLVQPFDGHFKNPLPAERDVIMIQVMETRHFSVT
jgi:hypothetical protein